MSNVSLRALWLRLKRLVDLSDYIDVDAAADNIRKNVAFRGPNVAILFCAIVIASVGLNVNSIPVIIGAMLVSPLMSPIVGLGMSLGTNDTQLLRSSLKNLFVMVGISILASTLYFLLSPLDMEHPTELLARTNPTIYDVLIALFGGFAGILEASRKEKGTVVVGVAIATALMPPLCTVGYGLASLSARFFFGALYLFFINLTFIALAAFVGTRYLGYKQIQETDPSRQRRSRIIVSLFLVALVVPSVISAISVIQETDFSRSANQFVAKNKNVGRSYIYEATIHTEQKPYSVDLYIAGEELTPDDYAKLYASAETFGIMSQQLIIHQNAAYQNMDLDENAIIRDLFHQNDQKLQEREQTIAELQGRVDSLQQQIAASKLPTEQIIAEVQAQYPQLTQVTLARSDNNQIVLLVSSPKKFAKADQQKLSDWLQIRLSVSSVSVHVINN